MTFRARKATFWQYFDIKDGMAGQKIAIASNKQTKRWISNKIGKSINDLGQVNIEGLGPNLISSLLKSQSARKLFHQEIRKPNWQEMYLAYFMEILWYLAAPPKKIT